MKRILIIDESCIGNQHLGELTFFLGLQINQSKARTSIHQQKYISEFQKKFEIDESKIKNAPIVTAIKLDRRRNTFFFQCLTMKLRYKMMLSIWYTL